MSARVSIVDYGMGNLRSVANAFAAVGGEPEIVTRAEQLAEAERIVLPGVGAFADGMRNLREGGWDEALEEEVRRKGKPFLGLCVGMQLLASVGLEHGETEGLGWVPGVCERLANGNGLRVPHIGWNDVEFTKPEGLYAGLEGSDSFYFVHSYVLRPEDGSVVSGVCDYGGPFAASIEAGNVRAAQFHPEKSHRAGLRMLANFLET
ncbi:MAG TPA: imidazole glycerol phosphate synthase subunit HisH [Gaiellaceae bacterium]|nr:imidazole glycerol phosphate synthase subunit HisH [Gaiellaceae bacterium]